MAEGKKGQKNRPHEGVEEEKKTALAVVKNGGSGGQSNGFLTRQEFHTLAQVPAEVEWFANIQNPRTRRAYQNDIHEFMAFVGIHQPAEFRIVTRAHILA